MYKAMKIVSDKQLFLLVLIIILATAKFAGAHCDTLDGPVVKDAETALEKGQVAGVLKWIPKDNEEDIREAFRRTLVVRTKGTEARELADMYFFETLVRVHRAGEGEPYTGLKPAGTQVSPAVAKADEALEKGNVDELAQKISTTVEASIRERFTAAAKARKHKDQSVEAGRKFVAAYVQFVHYVEAIHQMAAGEGAHHGHEATEAGKHQERNQPAATASEHKH